MSAHAPSAPWAGVLATLGDLPGDLLTDVLAALTEVAARNGLRADVLAPGDRPGPLQFVVRPRPEPDPLAPVQDEPVAAAWEVELRFPADEGVLERLDQLLDAITVRLDPEGEFCDDPEEEGDEICCYLYGPDPERLVAVAREVASTFPLPPGGSLLTKDQRRPGASATARLAL